MAGRRPAKGRAAPGAGIGNGEDEDVNRLYVLRPIDPNSGPWDPWYDRVFGFVVRAQSEVEARQIASTDSGEEDRVLRRSAWLDPSLTYCQELTPDGDVGVVLRDFQSA